MGEFGAELLKILKENMPLITALVAMFFRAEATNSKLKTRVLELELKLKENHEKVDADNAGKSAADVVDEAARKRQ